MTFRVTLMLWNILMQLRSKRSSTVKTFSRAPERWGTRGNAVILAIVGRRTGQRDQNVDKRFTEGPSSNFLAENCESAGTLCRTWNRKCEDLRRVWEQLIDAQAIPVRRNNGRGTRGT